MNERTGIAYRKAYDKETEGFKRIEGAKDGLKGSGGDTSKEYQNFTKSFDRYNGGLQKLGLKPERDDINLPVAEELKKRCDEAIRLADEYLRSDSKNEDAIKAVKKAKKALETDRDCLERAINTKLDEEGSKMRLNELFDAKAPSKPDGKDNKGSGSDSDGRGDDDTGDQDDN